MYIDTYPCVQIYRDTYMYIYVSIIVDMEKYMRAWKRTYLHADMHTRRHPENAHTRKQKTKTKYICSRRYIHVYMQIHI